ncbi:glycoside hydrolase [Bacteroidota bacterium]
MNPDTCKSKRNTQIFRILPYILLSLVIILFPEKVQGKIWTISNSHITVEFNDKTALVSVTDKRCDKRWEQKKLHQDYTVASTRLDNDKLFAELTGEINFTIILSLTDSGFEIELLGDENSEIRQIRYPAAFETPDGTYYILETDGEGLLLEADDKEYPLGNGITFYCGGGLAMPWMGVTDASFQTGYMAILETPYDAALRTFRSEEDLITFSPVWLASLGKLGYNRKIRYDFFDRGGYVAQCKAYRKYIWEKNRVLTLKENLLNYPALEKMIGAVHLYVWDNAREVEFAQELKASGINKAMILWDANHYPYPEIGYDNRLKELGYASGAYDLYTDLKLRDTIENPFDYEGPLRFARTHYPGKFYELVTRKTDGSTNSNQFGHTACPSVMRPEIEKRIDREMKEYPHECYFLDVYQANGLFECYAKEHPLTRQQFAEEVIRNYQFIAEKYNVYMGGEWGADYLGSNSIFVHGMMTLQRTWWGSGIENRGTIYYTGNWNSNPRPSIMTGSRTANDTYLKYSINEYTRVPLYELVYHDAVVTSWRWEDGNHHTPEIWWKKDLFNILYGTAPLWSIDRERWEAYKFTFIDSYKNIGPWLEQIGYDEMISHRFISDDHKVQESVFSSGKRVVVNFGTEDYSFEGQRIKGKGFLTMTE